MLRYKPTVRRLLRLGPSVCHYGQRVSSLWTLSLPPSLTFSPPPPPRTMAGGWIGGRPGRLLGPGPSCSSSYLTSCACFIWLHASQDSCSTVVTPLLLLTLVLVSAEWCCGGRWWSVDSESLLLLVCMYHVSALVCMCMCACVCT